MTDHKDSAPVRAPPLDILKPFLLTEERCVLRVYDDKHPRRILKPGDPVEGKLTAGEGHTGPELHIGMDVTQAMAEAWLADDLLHKAAAPLCAKIGAVASELTAHQYAALLSFVFNLGTGNPSKPEWTIWKRLRARAFDQVPLEMAKFVNWNGAKSEGLVKRRADEVVLWSTGEPGSQPSDPPSSVTRTEATPPTPADPKVVSTPMITTAATAITAASAGVAQLTQAVQPYADKNDHLAKIIATLAMVAAALAVAALVVTWLKHRSLRT